MSANPSIPFVLTGVLSLMAMSCGCRRGGPPVPPANEISVTSSEMAVPELPGPAWEPDDWPQWRGREVDGVASGPPMPTRWSSAENVVWKTAIPGRGHASPIVVGDRVVVETADESQQVQSVLCLDRLDGSLRWKTDLHRGAFEDEVHRENSQATSTVASDGERFFALFLNSRTIWATALDLEGKELWRTEVGSFASKFGYSASPIVYRSFLLIAADHQQGGFIAAVHRQSGQLVWRKSRPAKSSYATGRVISLGGRDQLVLAGCKEVASHNPLDGTLLWRTEGTAESTVGTPVLAGDLVIASGGYPEQDTVALKPDGTVAWRKNIKAYCTSMLVHDGHLYLVGDDGVARCLVAATGEEKWKQRLGGNFRVSPVLSGDQVLITDMSGKSTIFKADPRAFTLVAENQLGTEGFASPALRNGQLFLRVVEAAAGGRQEWLYCIGK